jgi:O-antigen/teichoic acid export membrane protein
MIPYACLSFAYIFLDRWLLQEFGGNLEQAFYGVGAQFAAVSLIATSAMLRVFWKEMAESHERGDTEGSRILYLRMSRSLFFVGTAISGFVIPWTSVITEVALGDAYLGGTTTLMIMFLYPVHQSIGQIGGAMLMATEHVVTQVYIGLVFMAVSMLVTYFVLAPASAYIPRLGAGSIGLAVKMVGMQFVQVNILGYIISRIWKWKFDWFYQFISLGGCMLVGLCAHQLSILFVGMDSVLLSVFVAGVIYAGYILSGLWVMPWLLGLTNEELKKLGNTVLLKLRVN